MVKELKITVVCFLLFISGNILSQHHEFEKGLSALSNDSIAKAVELFKKDIENEPSLEGYYNLGLAYQELKDIPASIWAFESALKINPSNAQVSTAAQKSWNMVTSELWTNPFSFLIKFVTLVGNKTWFFLSIIASCIAGTALFFLIAKKKNDRKKWWIILTLSLVFGLSFFGAGRKVEHHYKNFHYLIVTSEKIKTYLSPDGIELNHDLKIAHRYPIEKVNDYWIQFKTEDDRLLWVKKKEILYY